MVGNIRQSRLLAKAFIFLFVIVIVAMGFVGLTNNLTKADRVSFHEKFWSDFPKWKNSRETDLWNEAEQKLLRGQAPKTLEEVNQTGFMVRVNYPDGRVVEETHIYSIDEMESRQRSWMLQQLINYGGVK